MKTITRGLITMFMILLIIKEVQTSCPQGCIACDSFMNCTNCSVGYHLDNFTC